jgi:hypothetical protein
MLVQYCTLASAGMRAIASVEHGGGSRSMRKLVKAASESSEDEG